MHYQDSLRTELQHENDFVALSQNAGIDIHPRVLRILMQLLELNVHPSVLHLVLQKICANHPSGKRSKAGSTNNRSRSSTSSHSSAKSSEKM
ncbi:hypothetical protein R5R35_007181 [Gryllus longicercus]|uniref:Uncharacterized protein n=1 Tax=Gryllus longicercus TaxID=2509291 RepID=A0AAN9VHI5_9ORTH